MKKTILSMLFLLAGIGCFAQKSGIIIGVTDGHLGKYSGYAYMSTGTANNSSYPETRWTPGVGFNLGYQFGFDLGKSRSGKSRVLRFEWKQRCSLV